jgi:5-methyltetrahydropteroyltriglutamate--homocysteine methyltransferase
VDHIPTTHVGSLPRPADLLALLHAQKVGEPVDEEEFRSVRARAVRNVVQRQRDTGLDIVNDGEQGRISFAAYIFDRITGFEEGRTARFVIDDMDDFPEFRDDVWADLLADLPVPYCVGPVEHRGTEQLDEEIAALIAAVDGDVENVFMNAVSPGQIAFAFPNDHYAGLEDYLGALAEALRPEYEAVAAAGLTLQIDSPDLAMYKSVSMNDYRPEFQWYVGLAIEALNEAVRNIPPEQMRLHLCWGNGAWPHHNDAELREVLPTVLKARPRTLSIEASNPRHAHEWRVFEEIPLPEDKLLMPGLIDTTTTFIEHPDLIAERLANFASVVGKERLIAGTDCGLGTHAEHPPIHPEIAWAKLGSLVEGTRRANERLFAQELDGRRAIA